MKTAILTIALVRYWYNFTARNSSYGKVMFSQAVIPSVHTEGVSASRGSAGGGVLPGGYGEPARGTHPTGMHSCTFRILPNIQKVSPNGQIVLWFVND